MAKRLLGIRLPAGRHVQEVEYGLKEFVQGMLVGLILGILIATQLL